MAGLLEEIPRRSWLDWIAYWEVEPWGEDRADMRAAIIAATVHNRLRGARQSAKRVAEFLAFRPPPPRKMSEERKRSFIALLKPFARKVPRADAD